ncbi:DUF2478 domain-containing protein [Pseudomonas sp. F1_0610]|uniref:DUF2478 domain-containing protein n=1 Tax=Pseudomonas sp. F1_0610 TaxID=3114284 RepID=UPI0039C44AB1
MVLPLAAVVHAGNGEGDETIQQVIKYCRSKNWRVRGLVTERGKDPLGKLPMLLRDIYTQQIFRISQCLGSESTSCVLDLGGLAQASEVLRRAVREKPDLVIINRFGSAEAEGEGFSQEFGQLISDGIPVLTLINERYLSAWLHFAQDLAYTLPLDFHAIKHWVDKLKE